MSRFERPLFTLPPSVTTEVTAMGRRASWRVWHERLGISQSFEDIGSFDGAVNFAAFIMADRIEVVCETEVLPKKISPAEVEAVLLLEHEAVAEAAVSECLTPSMARSLGSGGTKRTSNVL
jgi:hypothetical protein